MKIKIATSDKRLHVVFPNFLLKSRLALRAVNRELPQPLTKKDLVKIYDILKRFRKESGELVLIDVKSAEGDVVRVIF